MIAPPMGVEIEPDEVNFQSVRIYSGSFKLCKAFDSWMAAQITDFEFQR
jgi:hypothetical protein